MLFFTESEVMKMQLSVPDNSFLDSFEHLTTIDLDQYNKNTLELFMLRVNANEFDYDLLVTNLMEPIITYSVSRKIREDYSNKPHTLTKKAISRFVESTRNTGELGELVLYAFLECHLGAPKILSKLELKTSTSLYVNGADGVHYLKLPNGNYQLIFGESKTIENLSTAILKAFTSIYEFKNEVNAKGQKKSGINYEKTLISDNLAKESFSDEDIAFITSLIYPSRTSSFRVDDAFGIFIGYQINIDSIDKKMPNDKFADEVKHQIITEVQQSISAIIQQISDKGLDGHSFYIYILPFTKLDESRKNILEGLTT